MANLQCPNCGGYKSSLQFSVVDAFFTAAYVAIPCPIIALFATILLRTEPPTPSRFYIVVIALASIVVMVFIFSIIRSRKKQNDYVCKICGYKWDKRNFPEGISIQVNRDLIEKGNVLLEQEEAERIRQQQWRK